MPDTTHNDDESDGPKALAFRLLDWFAWAGDRIKSGFGSARQAFWSVSTFLATLDLKALGLFYRARRIYRDWKRSREARAQSKESLAQEMRGEPSPDEPPEDEKIRKTIDEFAERMVEESPVGVAGPGAGDPRDATSEHVAAAQEALNQAVKGLPQASDWPVADEEDSARPDSRRAAEQATGFPEKTDDGQLVQFSSKEAHAADFLTEDEVIPLPRRSEKKNVDTEVRGYWESNPNADEKLQEAIRTPIVDRHIRTIVEHLITSRPKIKGPEDQAEAARRWFEVEVELNSGHQRGLNRFITDIGGQMLRYGSAAIFKQRTRSEVGEAYEDPLTGGQRFPVASYMIPDMATIEVFLDRRGRPRKWRQHKHLHMEHDPPKYSDRDVFLARLPSRNSSMYFWTPSLATIALYPIEVLRDLHETIEQHTKNIIDIPNYARVGDKNYLDGQVNEEMLRRIQRVVERTPRGSMPVLPWFVEIAQQESDEYVEQLTDAAHFWEKEVRRGVGGSKLQDGIGDSGTRNTSEVLISKEMRTAEAMVPEIQRAFRWLMTDVLMQRGVIDIDDVMGHDDMVSLIFEDIDMHKQIKREEHYVHAWQNDAYTHSEFRDKMGMDPDSEREDMYFSDIKKQVESVGTPAKTENRNRPGGSPRPKNPND